MPTRPRWIRKVRADLVNPLRSPLPTQIVSNEEFAPPPQTEQQRQAERVLLALTAEHAHGLGWSRRKFLQSSCGMAAAFVSLNTVFGRFFDVRAQELTDPAAGSEIDYFVLDAQTHHVAAAHYKVPENQAFLDYLIRVREFGGNWNPSLLERTIAPE
jgi:hypothetical protein